MRNLQAIAGFSFMTYQEAKEKGVYCKSEPPKAEKCKFCGEDIEYLGVCRNNEIKRWFLPICQCDEAIEEVERKNEQEILEIVRKEQQRVRLSKIENMIENCGMKKRFKNRTFSNYKARRKDQINAFNIAKSYSEQWEEAKEDGKGLYFVGSNGTGKTHLAAAIALELMPKGVGVIFRTAAGLLNDIKETFNAERSENEVIKTYTEADLLIIDDLGKEQCTDWAISHLFTIVNNRYEDCKPIIISSNYALDELDSALTPKGYNNDKAKAIVSRLRETCEVVPMYWKDFRSE